jgi:hypothetical protein
VSLRCPRCGREFDVIRFEFGSEITCPCGEKLSLDSGHEIRGEAPPRGKAPRGRGRGGKARREEAGGSGRGEGEEPQAAADWEALEREIFGAVNARQRARDYEQAEDIRSRADRISSLILHSDLPRVDIEIEIRKFRDYVLELFPEKEGLLDSVYVNRFKRLWAQFRDEDDPLFGRRR